MLDILNHLRVRRSKDSPIYHLVDGEPDSSEKGGETSFSADDTEASHNLTASTNQCTGRRSVAARWLRTLVVLLPSFLQPRRPDHVSMELHRTAWLDGLRGIAAFFVVWHHMSLIWFSWDIHNGWNSFDDPIIQMPILRLAVTGTANVMVFFVISGYALSYKPLTLLRQDRHLDAYKSLASSSFRRHPRLFLPAAIISSLSIFVAWFGWFGDPGGMPGAAVSPLNPPRFDSLWDQVSDYAGKTVLLTDPFGGNGDNWTYNNVLWTLPIEFRSSLVIFGFLLATSRLGPLTRSTIGLGVALYSLWYIHWGEFLFLGGMLVADAHLYFRRAEDRQTELLFVRSSRPQTRRRWLRIIKIFRSVALRRIVSLMVFVLSMFVLSMPKLERGGAQALGYQTLAALISEHFLVAGSPDKFWTPLAAVLLVFSIDRAPFMQKIFTTAFAQYLGRISYALYLVHLIILHSLGFRLGRFMIGITGSDTNVEYFTGVFFAAIVAWAVAVWMADLGWRFVDARCVWIAGWAHNRLST